MPISGIPEIASAQAIFVVGAPRSLSLTTIPWGVPLLIGTKRWSGGLIISKKNSAEPSRAYVYALPEGTIDSRRGHAPLLGSTLQMDLDQMFDLFSCNKNKEKMTIRPPVVDRQTQPMLEPRVGFGSGSRWTFSWGVLAQLGSSSIIIIVGALVTASGDMEKQDSPLAWYFGPRRQAAEWGLPQSELAVRRL